MCRLNTKRIISVFVCLMVAMASLCLVKVDANPDTFGYTTAGTLGKSDLKDYIYGSKYNLPQDGVAESISAYIYCYYAGSAIKYAIYDSSLNLVAQTEEYVHSSDGVFKNWLTLSFPSSVSLTAGDYWLVAWGGYKTYIRIYYDSGDTDQTLYKSLVYTGSFPSTLSPTGYLPRKYSIYCTYSPSGAAQWNSVEIWTGSLVTRTWTAVEMWSGSLIARTWRLVETWTVNLVARTWHDIAEWSFNLITHGWHTITQWILTVSTTNIPALFIGIIFTACILFLVIGLALKKRS